MCLVDGLLIDIQIDPIVVFQLGQNAARRDFRDYLVNDQLVFLLKRVCLCCVLSRGKHLLIWLIVCPNIIEHIIRLVCQCIIFGTFTSICCLLSINLNIRLTMAAVSWFSVH